MDSWSGLPQDMPDLMGSAAPNNPDDWEDWLRWDPANESHSPENSSKDSTDSPIQDSSMTETYPWLDNIAPPLIIGEDSSFSDLSAGLNSSTLNFSSNGQMVDPFIFGADASLQPVADSLYTDSLLSNKDLDGLPYPSSAVPSQPGQLNTFLSTDSARRKSHSSPGTENIDSLTSPVSQAHTYSSNSSLSPQASQPPKKKAGRKRKSDTATQEGTGSGEGGPPVKKTSHNVIEKRYRNNLNDKILELRDSVPSLRAMSKPNGEEDDSEELDGLTPAHKLNKSTIMAKATEYIRHLEKRNKTLSDDMAALKSRMAALEQAYTRNSAMVNATGGSTLGRSRQPSVRTGNATSPMLGSSDQMRQRNGAQHQSMPSFDTQVDEEEKKTKYVRGNGGSGMMGKLMVGSMAGLMVMEGFSEHSQGESQSGKGLFAAPLHLIKRGLLSTESSSTSLSTSQALLPFFKVSILLTAVVYLLLPLFQQRSRKKTQTLPHITLTAAPSLAASVEVKRKAWLTAIQSVWTPRHFLIEVVLVTVRMIELSLRRIIGFDKYAELLGMTKDDEAARLKAWDIAIDAQLAGGDVEVSYHRLLLTLMASGTLPDSPIRLMQKAVHFRIFFWELANAGYGNLFMFKDFTARVARIYWDSARAQQQGIVSGSLSKVDELGHTIELLPEHLAKLVELECDEVLTDNIIQRAYNLAWNRPSAENTASHPTLDTVVHDPAIRSPLDAVAAWFTNTVVDEGLALALHDSSDADIVTDVEYLTTLAAATAPPASSTRTRALVAKAVLLESSRESDIAASLESMPHVAIASPMLGRSPSTGHLNVVHHVPLTAEVRVALTLAKIMSLGHQKSSASARDHAAIALNGLSIQPKGFTLLTAVAGYKVLEKLGAAIEDKGKTGMERLAGGLRVWVGTRAGKHSGLSAQEKGIMVKRCVTTAKRVGGWKDEDADSGYGSGLSRRGSGEEVAQ